MELLQLQYFYTAARMENMTRAAQELHVSQPSLSKTISRLEEQIGVPLFERKGRRILLNEAGRCFLSHVEKILQELENGINEVQDLACQKDSRVSVGSATARLLPNLIKAYLSREKDVKLRLLQVTHHSELLQKLDQGEIDISISALPLQKKNICCRALMEEAICLVVPQNHVLAEKKEIRLQEIGEEPLVYYTAECGLREIINHFCEQVSFYPNISCECTTPEVTCGLVEAGLGLAFLPEYLSNMEYTRQLVWIPVKEPELKRTIWVSWNPKRYLSRTARGFLQFLFDWFSSETNLPNQ